MSFSKVESCFAYCSITENEYTEEWMKKVYSDPKTRKGWIETILVKCQKNTVLLRPDSGVDFYGHD